MDDCCLEVIHAIKFDSGLLVKEDHAECLGWKCFASVDTVFCLATRVQLGPIHQPEHRAVTGADT